MGVAPKFFSPQLHTMDRQLRNLHNAQTFMKYLTFENRQEQKYSIGNLGLCTSKVRVHVPSDVVDDDDDDANDVAVAKHQKMHSSSSEIQPLEVTIRGRRDKRRTTFKWPYLPQKAIIKMDRVETVHQRTVHLQFYYLG